MKEKEFSTYLNKCLKDKTLPPQLPEVDKGRVNWKCSFCPFKTYCRGKGWEEKLKVEIKKVK